MDITERVTKIETILPMLATKEDLARLEGAMHCEFTTHTWCVVAFMSSAVTALAGAVYYVARFVH